LNDVANQRRLLAFGKTGLGYAKLIAEQKKAGLEGDKLAAEVLGLNQKNFTALNSPIRAAAGGEAGIAAYVEALYADSVMGALARKVKPKEQALAENLAMFKRDPQQWVTAHSNLEGTHLLDALKMSQENEAEKARIASRMPALTATAIGAPNATGAGLVVPGAAAVAPVTKEIAPGVKVAPTMGADDVARVTRLISNGNIMSLGPNERWTLNQAGNLVPEAIPAGQEVAVKANALAPAAAAGVNALAAPTGNDATLQAMAAERKRLTDRLSVLTGLRYSKGVENEMKDVQAQLKELSTPINLREAGTAITPFGAVTAAPAPGEMEKLALAEAAARKAGNTALADVLAGQIKVKNQLRDERTEVEKMLAITADPNASTAAKDAANGRIANLTHVAKDAVPAHIQEYEYAKKNNNYAGTLADFLHPVQEPALIQEYNFAVKNGFKGSIYAFKSAPEHAPALVQEFEYAKKNGYKGSIADFKALTTPRVAVENPNQPGNVILVSPSESTGKTPAKDITGIAPKEIQAREAKYPQALQAVKTLDAKTEGLAKDIETLANHPGLAGISGLVYGRTPSVTRDARAAQALYDSIVARGGFAELQSMRAASPTGGALGNVSNQEGQYLRDAFAAINRTQDTADLKANLLKAANQARESKARVKEAFDATYDYRANRGTEAAPAPSLGIDTSNPLLK